MDDGARGSGAQESGALRLGLAGFAATAVAFGPARTAYGLFLPDFRAEFGLSTGAAGVGGSALQVGYLLSLLATGLLVGRLGPRALTVAGGLFAASGMALVALSLGPLALALGVVLAGVSAGLSWSPYSDAVGAGVPEDLKGRVLSVVSTGATLGIAATGVVALLAAALGLPWRAAWLAFAAGGAVSAALNLVLLGSLPRGFPRSDSPARDPRAREAAGAGWLLLRPGSAPLFAVSLSLGAVIAFYWSFAADLLVSRAAVGSVLSGVAAFAGPLLYVALGIVGFAGLFAGELVGRFGLRPTLRAVLLCLGVGIGLLGVAPGTWPAVVASAVLYGAGVSLFSALLSVWSSSVFPERPSAGFSAALLVFAAGSVPGPAVLGAFGGRFGLEAAFVVAAALALSNLLVRPAESERDEGAR